MALIRGLVLLSIGLCMLKDVHCTCSGVVDNIDLTKVASLCLEGTVTGRRVYIDADEGVNATGLTSGQACTCQVTTTNTLFTSVLTYFSGYKKEVCGTGIAYEHAGTTRTIGVDNCYTLQQNFDTRVNSDIAVHLVRERQPYKSTYCLMFEPKTCAPNEFQCGDMACIRDTYVCDQYPDCADGSDETNCGVPESSCTEGRVFCKTKCINSADWTKEACQEAAASLDKSSSTKESTLAVTSKDDQSNQMLYLILGLVGGFLCLLFILGVIVYAVRRSEWYARYLDHHMYDVPPPDKTGSLTRTNYPSPAEPTHIWFENKDTGKSRTDDLPAVVDFTGNNTVIYQ